eukprot:GFUD01058742.1.p1 GENE.GFUD01058742.1~~GFUD01058742.1.p1  ORF type:complete len:155 (+),score=59.70 GFUD01058742.1:81-545(+)
MRTVLFFLLCGYSAVAGHGYHHHKHPRCTREIETVTRNLCRLELEKSCTTETKTFVKITGFEDKDCKEIEICKHGYGYYGHGYHGHGYHGYHGKREAHELKECEKETKEICKKVPVKEEVTKDVEFCKGIPKKVCEDKELQVPRIVCQEDEAEE